jgi:pilus assembly protein TadC
MLFQEGPAETFQYMALGFGVIFGILGFFLFSLTTRLRNMRQEYELLEEIDREKEQAADRSAVEEAS